MRVDETSSTFTLMGIAGNLERPLAKRAQIITRYQEKLPSFDFLSNLILRQHKERELVAVGHRIQLGQTSSVRKLAAVGHMTQLSPNTADAQHAKCS